MNGIQKNNIIVKICGLLLVGVLFATLSACSSTQTGSVDARAAAAQPEVQINADAGNPTVAATETPRQIRPKQKAKSSIAPALPTETGNSQIGVNTDSNPATGQAIGQAAVSAQPLATATANPAATKNPASQSPLEVKPEAGYRAPDFTLPSLDGQTVSLSSLSGHPIVISYWSSWCIPCKQELPLLNRLSQEYASSGLQIITIDAIEQDTLDKVNNLLGDLGVTLPVLLDQGNQFHSAYNQLFFPTVYFIDANGVLRFIKLGSANENELRTKLDQLVNNQF